MFEPSFGFKILSNFNLRKNYPKYYSAPDFYFPAWGIFFTDVYFSRFGAKTLEANDYGRLYSSGKHGPKMLVYTTPNNMLVQPMKSLGMIVTFYLCFFSASCLKASHASI
jgi:hypothetical protein